MLTLLACMLSGLPPALLTRLWRRVLVAALVRRRKATVVQNVFLAVHGCGHGYAVIVRL